MRDVVATDRWGPLKWIVYLALLAWVGLLLAQKIDLTTADLGRHITNGSKILGSAADRNRVLHTNFYSYTMPGQPFINHHWLSGVVFYLIWRSFGFIGLSLWNVLLGVIAFGLFFDVARRAGNFWLAAAIATVVMPLSTARAEVRPEMFTYFLTGLFVWILWQDRAGRLGHRWLYGLPALMMLWVNLHIGFVFGFLVLGAFLLDASLPLVWSGVRQTARVKVLAVVAGLSVLAGLVNPFFFAGFLYPLSILSQYGYTVAENQSVPFLERLGLGGNQIFLLFKLTVGAIVVSGILAAVRNFRKLDAGLLAPALVSAVMAYNAIRNFVTFGLFAVLALTGTLMATGKSSKGKKISVRDYILMPVALVAVAAALWQQYQEIPQILPTAGLGLLAGVEDSADFVKQNRIGGPIFNDYDTGGYLIYKLSIDGANQVVFVDNRPEAYSVEFFQDVYIRGQKDEAAWQQLDKKYHFNVIFFSRRDNTSWGREFLSRRARDREWAPVFADGYNIVFLRRDNPANADVIQKHLLVVRGD